MNTKYMRRHAAGNRAILAAIWFPLRTTKFTNNQKKRCNVHLIYEKLVVKSTNIVPQCVFSSFCFGGRGPYFFFFFLSQATFIFCYLFLFSSVDCKIDVSGVANHRRWKIEIAYRNRNFLFSYTHHHHISIFPVDEMGLHRTAENGISINLAEEKNVDS